MTVSAISFEEGLSSNSSSSSSHKDFSPDRFEKVDSIIMMMYGSLSALVGSYFGFAKAQEIDDKKDKSKI